MNTRTRPHRSLLPALFPALFLALACPGADPPSPTSPQGSPSPTPSATLEATPPPSESPPPPSPSPTASEAPTARPTETPPPAECRYATAASEDGFPEGALFPTHILTGEGGSAGIIVEDCADLTGDGRPDMVVAATSWSDGTSVGRLYVVELPIRESAPLSESFAVVQGEGGLFVGPGFDCRSDVNGDGQADLVVGALALSSISQPRVAIFQGPMARGERLVPSVGDPMLAASRQLGTFGWSISVSPDLTGDGIVDIAVSAPFDAVRGAERGLVYVFAGPFPPTGEVLKEAFVIEGVAENGQFGMQIEGAEDINGDGQSDLIITANRETGALCESGAVYAALCPCGPETMSARSLLRFEGPTFSEHLGKSLGTLDLDGDSDVEILVGAPGNWGSVCIAPEPDMKLVGRARVLDYSDSEGLVEIGVATDARDPRGNTFFGTSLTVGWDGPRPVMMVGAASSSTAAISAVGSLNWVPLSEISTDPALPITAETYGADYPNPSSLGEAVVIGDLLGHGQLDVAGGANSYMPWEEKSPTGGVFVYDGRCFRP